MIWSVVPGIERVARFKDSNVAQRRDEVSLSIAGDRSQLFASEETFGFFEEGFALGISSWRLPVVHAECGAFLLD